MPDEQTRKLFNRLSPAEEQGRSAGGAKLIEASHIVRGCQAAGTANKNTEPVNRKERRSLNEIIRMEEEVLLKEWTRQNDCLQTSDAFLQKYGSRKIGEGSEAIVYLSFDEITVLKVNDASFHGNWLEFFDRLAIHNTLFPETMYQLAGFTYRTGFRGEPVLAAIVTQPFIKTRRGASFEEVKADMALMGYHHLKRDDYYNPKTGVLIEDLHDENVLVNEFQNLIYIDPAIFLEQPEMNLAGNRIICFNAIWHNLF